NAGVEAEFLADVVAFRRSACDADGPATPEPRELSHDAADRAGSRRHDDRLPRLRLADFLQAEVSRHPRHAEHAEVGAQGRALFVHAHRFLRRAVKLPTKLRDYFLPHLQRRMFRFDDFAHGLPDHDLAELHTLHVTLRVAHAPAHVGVERKPQVPDQHLALRRLRQRRFFHPEVVLRNPALRPAGEDDAKVLFHGAEVALRRTGVYRGLE